jgi:hypothetical protein
VTTATQPSVLRLVEPAGAQAVEQQGARDRRCRSLRGRERGGLERAEERRQGGAAPEAGAVLGDDAPGLGLAAGRRLDLDVERVAVLEAERRDAFERRRRLAGEGAAVPRAGVEPRQLAPGRSAARPWPLVVRCSVASCSRKGTPSAESLTSHSKAR